MINELLTSKNPNPEFKTDINKKTDNDDTALMIATEKSNEQAVIELLKFDELDVNLANKYGNTAYVIATKETIK